MDFPLRGQRPASTGITTCCSVVSGAVRWREIASVSPEATLGSVTETRIDGWWFEIPPLWSE